jgi:hypothetical protein
VVEGARLFSYILEYLVIVQHGFCLLQYSLCIRGFTLTFGAFQTYYQHDFLKNSSPSAISWIGTVQSWLLILVGVLSGPLFDLGWFRPMLIIGNGLVIFGIFMLSLCKTYWQVFLAQGVCMGLVSFPSSLKL